MYAYELLEKGWCQGAYARDAKGNAVASHNEDATAWCPLGALRRTCPGHRACTIVSRISELLGHQCVHVWNDDPTRMKEEVVALVKKAEMAVSAQGIA